LNNIYPFTDSKESSQKKPSSPFFEFCHVSLTESPYYAESDLAGKKKIMLAYFLHNNIRDVTFEDCKNTWRSKCLKIT